MYGSFPLINSFDMILNVINFYNFLFKDLFKNNQAIFY